MNNELTPAQKAELVQRAAAMFAEGKTQRDVAASLGQAVATLHRWRSALLACGGDAWEAFAAPARGGRPAAFDFPAELVAIARWHRLAKGSLPVAVHFFCKDSRVPAAMVSRLRAIEERALLAGREPSYPPSVRRAFHVSASEMADFRNKKAGLQHELVSPRGLSYIDEAGEAHDLLPGQLWELDDYSTNQPYVWRDAATGELYLGRQVLGGIDVASAAWLGFDHIGRERDAYRGEDIVRYIGRLFRSHGMPLILRLERGSWESSFVHGIEVDGLAGKWGGLDALCRINHVWKSKAKGTIEGGFDHLQTWLGHTGRDIGRVRGEFEEAQKAWRQARTTGADPYALGFLSQEESAAAHEAAAREINSRQKNRAAIGERISPDDLRARHGWHTVPVPASEAWRLLPYKERRIVNAGVVEGLDAAKRGWPLTRWIVNGGGLHLESGHAVLIAYDPARPDLGCHVCNADTGPRNRDGWRVGEYLCTAEHQAMAPQFDLSGRVHDSIRQRKAAAAGASTSFRAIIAAGKATPREQSAVGSGGRMTATGGTLADIAPDTGRIPAGDRLARKAGEEAGLAGLGRATTPAATGDRMEALRRAQQAADMTF